MIEVENIVRFRTVSQAILWEKEIKGQISDGCWENAKPWRHWLKPINSTAVVAYGEGDLGPNWKPVRRYNFCNSLLVEVCGDRMIGYIKEKFPGIDYDIKSLKKDLREMSKVFNAKVPDMKNWRKANVA